MKNEIMAKQYVTVSVPFSLEVLHADQEETINQS